MCEALQEAVESARVNTEINELKKIIEKLKPLAKNQLYYSYCEEPDLWRNNKPIFTNDWLWCHGSDWHKLHEVTKRYGYSNAIFRDGKRASGNVVYLGNLLIYDYDDRITIDEMKSRIESLGVSALIVTTLNHQKDKKGVVCDRFRLILQLKDCMGRDISTNHMEEILQEVDSALELGGAYDKACKTIERFYSPAPTQEYFYFEGMTIDVSEIVAEVKKPKVKPMVVPRPKQNYADSDLSLKKMREYVRENIPHTTVVRELEAKGLVVKRNGAIYLDKKHVGNIHPETRMIADWGASEHMDIVGVLDKFYGESYTDNTKRLYKEMG